MSQSRTPARSVGVLYFFRAVMRYCGKAVVNDETTTYINVGK